MEVELKSQFNILNSRKMKRLITALVLLISLTSFGQTPFPNGAWFPNATEQNSADSIPVMDGDGVVNSYVNQKSIRTPTLKKVSDDYKYYNIDKNATVEAYGVTPSTVKDSLGNIYTCTVSNTGELYVTKYYRDGRNYSRKLGVSRDLKGFKTDTHHSPSILIDERTDAEFPLIIFQSDHNESSTQYWRFNSFDIENEELPTPKEIPGSYDHMNGNDGNQLAYNHSYRWNDKIYVFNRVKNFAGGSAGPHRSWRVAYSGDNGDSWVEKIVFDAEPVTGWLYMFVTQEKDSPWINLNFSSHINSSLDGRVMYMRLNMNTGELTNLENTVVSNLPDYIENEPSEVVNPYIEGLEVHTPSNNEDNGTTPQTSTNNTGNLITTFYRESKKYLSATEFDRNGNIIRKFDIDTINEDFKYQRRLDFLNDVNDYTLLFKWKEKSTVDNVTVGESLIEKININTFEKDTLVRGNYQLGRPSIIPDHSGFLFSEFTYQNSYVDFTGVMILHEFEKNSNSYPKNWNDIYFSNTNINNWNEAYNRGDYRDYGLGTGFENNDALTPGDDIFDFNTTGFLRVSSFASNIPISSNGYAFRMYRTDGNKKIIYYADNGETFENLNEGSWQKITKESQDNTFTGTNEFTNPVTGAPATADNELATLGQTKTQKLEEYTVSTLPASPNKGDQALVTDADTPSWNTTVTGGGSSEVVVWYNGTNWIIH